MRIADEVFLEFKQGESVSELRNKYRSKRRLYEALDRFLLKADASFLKKVFVLC